VDVEEGDKMAEEKKLSPSDPRSKILDNKQENTHRKTKVRKSTVSHK
jgi:hypothetical protein